MGTGIEVTPDLDPGEVLAHYGVKGMRWGHTKADDSGGGSGGGGSAKKKPTHDEVVTARQNLQRQAIDYQQAKKWAKKNTAKNSPERMLADEKVAQLKVDFLNNPDRVTATYLTRGEKVISALLIPAAAPSLAAGAVVRGGVRRHIAKKQANGGYNK